MVFDLEARVKTPVFSLARSNGASAGRGGRAARLDRKSEDRKTEIDLAALAANVEVLVGGIGRQAAKKRQSAATLIG